MNRRHAKREARANRENRFVVWTIIITILVLGAALVAMMVANRDDDHEHAEAGIRPQPGTPVIQPGY